MHQRAADWSRAEAGEIWTGRTLTKFQKEHGRPPGNPQGSPARDGAGSFLANHRRPAAHQPGDALDDCIDSVENELDTLMAHAKDVDRGLGSLTVDPELEIPEYISAVDIHVMPGNYYSEYTKDDMSQGAVYERGSYLYTHGYNGPRFDNIGKGLVEYIKKHYPDFKPRRILDMGAAIGNSTLPYCDAFPDAEIYAIDIGAPLVRYGYARANALGKAMHFSQQNAEHTDFPDGYFDLIVSHIMFHETSREAIPKIFAESRRLLAPGGKMVHADFPDISKIPDLFQQVSVNQDHYDNNEPMWASYHSLDLKARMQEAGFAQDTIRLDSAPMVISVPPDHNDPRADKTVHGMFGYGVFAAEA